MVERPDGTRFLPFEQIADLWQAEKQRADSAEHRVRQLSELSRKVRLGQATAEELALLVRLEEANLVS